MGGTFKCGLCNKSQHAGKRFTVKPNNIDAVRMLFASTGRASLAPALTVGMVLCTVSRKALGSNKHETTFTPPCMSQSDQAALESSLVGRRLSMYVKYSRLTDMDVDGQEVASLCDGVVKSRAADGEYVAEFETPVGLAERTLSEEKAKECMQIYMDVQQRLKAERAKANDAAWHRAQRAEEKAAAELERVRAGVERRAANKRAEERARARSEAEDAAAAELALRRLHWPEVLSPQWWEDYGNKISPSLHKAFFGFPTPSSMCVFFEVFFDEEAKQPGQIGLSQYQLFALALMRMRTGWTVQFLAALTGANRGRLGSMTAEWIHKCGAVGRMFIGVPDEQYLLDSMPASYTECGMGNVGAVGDATDFMTETLRSPFLKKARLMQWSDKVHHAAARGTSFCSANGMTIIALALTFGRCSELNCVKACAQWLKKLGPRMALAYDKGIRGMRSLLPWLNYVFMPCFLAPSQGKTQLTVNEAIETRGVARNRYVIEVTYKRVKEWHLLKEVALRWGGDGHPEPALTAARATVHL